MDKIYDISPPLQEEIGVFPGDVPLTFTTNQQLLKEGISLSAMKSTLHLGSHVDAPSHLLKGGLTIEQLDIHSFIGPCQVMEVLAPPGTLLFPNQLQDPIAPRLLLRTGSFLDPYSFQEFAALSVDLITSLHKRGVILIGVDTPSIDLLDSKDLLAHREAFSLGMIVLEGLLLSQVPEGSYELIALPLALKGMDGSPVRAVLRSKED